MISIYMFHKIRKLHKDGLTKKAIANELGIHRQTVAKYLLSSSPPKYSSRINRTRSDPFATYQEKVELWLDKSPELTAEEIYELLIEEGYSGSVRTVRRRLSCMRKVSAKERFFEQEYTPGEQAQFDFKEKISIPFRISNEICYLHFGTLPYSNKFFIRAYPGKNFECFIDGIHEFFDHINGMTRNIRIDNLSPCVSKVLKGSKRIYTEAFTKAVEYYGFNVLPCSPGKGNEKGDVERDIQTHSKRILNLIKLKSLRFDSFEDLNNWLVEYCQKRTSEKIEESFKVERDHLMTIIKKNKDVLCRAEERTSTKYGMVKIKDHVYSVPDRAIGKRCRVLFGVEDVYIHLVDTNECVAVHPRKEKESVLLEHVVPSLIRKPNAMIRWGHKKALFPNTTFSTLYEYLKRKTSYRAEQDYLKILNLIHNTTIGELTIAIELVLECKTDDIYFKICELLFKENNPASNNKTFEQPNLTIDLETYNNLIPGVENVTPRTC